MTEPGPARIGAADASAEVRDKAARSEACDAAASILLEAPAGSGKTAVLTQRFLTLLARVDDPGEILAITFTRKAAAEMRARVVRALRDQIPPEDPQAPQLRALAQQALARGAARGWRIDSEPQTLRIQTIDSFNFWLASQLPIASGTGGALTVTEAPGELYRRAARRALLAAESDPQLGADAQLLFERHDNHWMYLERLIAQMLRERGHWLRFVAGSDPQRLCAEVNASLAALARARLTALAALLPEPLRQRAARLPGVGRLGTEPADLARWKELARLLLVREDWRVQIGPHRLGSGFADAGACRELRELIDALRGLAGAREAFFELCRAPTAALSEEEVAAIRALSRVLSRAAAELHGEFAVAGRVDYTYVAGAAREALTEQGLPTDLALRTGLALRHILVDEFQDTSLAQFQLLTALTAGWAEGDGRTLFVVGDPMQSIYRFRDAEVGLFLRARSAGIGEVRLRPLRLLRNFRADPALVAFANELFARTFPPRDDAQVGAVSYRQSTPARAATARASGLASSSVTLRLFPGERVSEAEAIALRAAELRACEPHASIAVLVVAHAHAVPVIAALEARGIAALGVDLVPLRERMIVRDLVQLTRALFDPADRSAWLAVLRAPWCGARLATLTALSAPDDRELVLEALGNAARLARCDRLDRPRLERVRDVLTAALAARPLASPADWVEATWMRLGGSDACSAQELGDARAFLAALAARTAAGEWRGPEDLPALLENLCSAADAGADPVQVMTIHRAKGLEFDHVIVPALDRPTRSGERRLLRWIDLPGEGNESDLLIAPAAAVEADKPTDLDTYVGGLLRARELHERGRLLYVAVTRARRTLWLSGAPPVGADGSPKPDPRSFLAILWPVLDRRFECTPPAAHPAPRASAAPLIRLRADWQPAELPPAVSLVRLPPAYVASESPEFSWVGETQRHIGTVVHAWLARLAHAPRLPSPESLGEESAGVVAQLARLGVPVDERAGAFEIILTALRRTLADERGRWILSGAHSEAHSEWPLSGVSAGRLRNVVIDRSFIDASGTRWVIDYKTSRHEGGDLEGFLAQEMERYRPQLVDYRSLAARLGPEPVRAALYFPLIGAFTELR
jgi:ATP-dependent helicase/nuclease subunit A